MTIICFFSEYQNKSTPNAMDTHTYFSGHNMTFQCTLECIHAQDVGNAYLLWPWYDFSVTIRINSRSVCGENTPLKTIYWLHNKHQNKFTLRMFGIHTLYDYNMSSQWTTMHSTFYGHYITFHLTFVFAVCLYSRLKDLFSKQHVHSAMLIIRFTILIML